jgi:hypothetical protein
MTIYLRMLSLSLECDDTIWQRVDDSCRSLLEVFLVRLASHLELFKSFLSPRFHPFLSHSFVIPSFCSLILTFRWTFYLTHSLFYASDLDFASIYDLLLVRDFGSIDLLVHFLWVSALIVDLVLWHSTSSSLFHSYSGGWVCRFMPNHGHV